MNNHTLIKSVLDCLSEDINKYKNEIAELKHKLNTRNEDAVINKIIKPLEPEVTKLSIPAVEVPVVPVVEDKKSRAEYQKGYQKRYREKKKVELAELKAKVK